jgi:hypothetical protein
LVNTPTATNLVMLSIPDKRRWAAGIRDIARQQQALAVVLIVDGWITGLTASNREGSEDGTRTGVMMYPESERRRVLILTGEAPENQQDVRVYVIEQDQVGPELSRGADLNRFYPLLPANLPPAPAGKLRGWLAWLRGVR